MSPFNREYKSEIDIPKYNKEFAPEDQKKIERRRKAEYDRDLKKMTREVWDE